MRIVGLLAVFFVLSPGAVSAQVAAQTNWAEKLITGKDGTDSRDLLTHNFGAVPRGTQLYHRFELKNIYDVDLEISLRVGCTCVTATPLTRDLKPLRVLKRLEEGYIDVLMDATRFVGPKKVNIYFSVGHPPFASSATLEVIANSRVDVVLNPGDINFGVIAQGQETPPRIIDVEYAGALAWTAELVKDTAPLTASIQQLYRRPGQVGYRVTVALTADVPAGTFKHELMLRTNDPASPLVPILVEAAVQASLSAVPNPLPIGRLRVGQSVTKSVLVRGAKPFRVLAVDGQGEGLVAELPAAAAKVQVVKVKYQPDKPGELRRQLQIKTDLDQEAPLSVTVEGAVDP